MSHAEAVRQAKDLRVALLDHGVERVSIELVEGRSGSGWVDTRFVATMGHHIVSRRSQGLTPGLRLVKQGRSDLPGPLCNGYGGFDLTARIICMAWANHPGLGGPYTVEAGTIPANNGRPYFFGWEFEGGLNLADWDEPFRRFMGQCHAGTLAWLGRSERSHIDHKHWAPTRKIDRLGYTLGTARAEARTALEEAMSKVIAGLEWTDYDEWPTWAKAAIVKNIEAGTIRGLPDPAGTNRRRFDANRPLTRAEAAALLDRIGAT